MKHLIFFSSFFLFRDESGENEASVSNKFANDGSFLQQFLKLQKEKSSTGKLTLGQQKVLPLLLCDSSSMRAALKVYLHGGAHG